MQSRSWCLYSMQRSWSNNSGSEQSAIMWLSQIELLHQQQLDDVRALCSRAASMQNTISFVVEVNLGLLKASTKE